MLHTRHSRCVSVSLMFIIRRSSKMQDNLLLLFLRGICHEKRPTVKLRKTGIKRADLSLFPTEKGLKGHFLRVNPSVIVGL